MYGNYGFGGESDEAILRRGPVCGTSPGFADNARWGLSEAKNAWGMFAVGTVGIGPLVVAPWVGKLFMKDASYGKRLFVTNAAVVLAFAAKNFGAGEGSWRRACERKRQEAAGGSPYRDMVREAVSEVEDEVGYGYPTVTNYSIVQEEPYLCVSHEAEKDWVQPLRLLAGYVGGPIVMIASQYAPGKLGHAAFAAGLGMSIWSLSVHHHAKKAMEKHNVR